jgi:prepilin-type N-terminal cleavage/methylation domain-containing protein
MQRGEARYARYARTRAARHARGFTLIELMTVVAIVGVLAVVAYAAYHKFVTTSHQTEANAVLSGIKNRQENYKAETGGYLSGTGLAANQNTGTFNVLFPMCAGSGGKPGAQKYDWPSGGNCTAACCPPWQKLKINTTAPTFYGYSFVAGMGPTGLPTISIEGTNPFSTLTGASAIPTAQPWFVATAVADSDGNGIYTTSMISSLDNEIHIDTENE